MFFYTTYKVVFRPEFHRDYFVLNGIKGHSSLSYALPQIVLLATVAYASAGLYSGYGGLYGYGSGYGYGGYGLGHGVAAIAPAVTYAHAPVATSYANTYKVSAQTLDVTTRQERISSPYKWFIVRGRKFQLHL